MRPNLPGPRRAVRLRGAAGACHGGTPRRGRTRFPPAGCRFRRGRGHSEKTVEMLQFRMLAIAPGRQYTGRSDAVRHTGGSCARSTASSGRFFTADPQTTCAECVEEERTLLNIRQTPIAHARVAGIAVPTMLGHPVRCHLAFHPCGVRSPHQSATPVVLAERACAPILCRRKQRRSDPYRTRIRAAAHKR